MKKILMLIIVPALTLLISLTTIKNVNADTSYISNIVVSYNGSAETNSYIGYETGCTEYVLDMNNGYSTSNFDQGGIDVYINYQTSDNVDNAVTGLLVLINETPDSYIYNSCTYYPVAGYDCNNNTKITKPEFNKGASGDKFYLYYTKDNAAGSGLTELRAFSSMDELNYDKTYYVVKGINGTPFDLNTGAGGMYVYLQYHTAGINTASVFTPSSIVVIVIGSIVILGSVVAVAVISTKNKKQAN